MIYDSTPHQSTGLTPHNLVYGEEMRMPLDLMTEKLRNNENMLATEYAASLEENLRNAYDRNVRSRNYEVGDLVWRNQRRDVP